MTDLIIDSWDKCYPSNWKGLIVQEAITHPAKFSSRLIRRIYQHIADEGWVNEGDSVFDPFGGVALGALEAMRRGLSWRGVELEERFAGIGNENIASWNNRFSSMPHWCADANLIKGDSRNLFDLLKNEIRTAAISSPPFGEAQQGGGIALSVRGQSTYQVTGGVARTKKAGVSAKGFGYQGQGVTDGNLSTLPASHEGFLMALSSPPYADSIKPSERGSGFDYSKARGKGGKNKTAGRENITHGYGVTDGNLGSMIAGDFHAAISSPPFRQSSGGTNTSKGMDPATMKRHAAGNSGANAYGETAGQLANMDEGDFAQAVSSPPYEKGTEGVMRAGKFKNPEAFARLQMTKGHGASFEAKMRAMKTDEERASYGDTAGNIGNDSGNDFWSAARLIVEQSFLTLKPGGHACWVVKDFVKKGKIVPFCEQWRMLCESVGFITLHEHHAQLVRHKGTSNTLDGQTIHHITSSKSFFRRVAESHGSPAIDYEVVFCMERPA